MKLRKRQTPNIPGRLNWACRGVESILEHSGSTKDIPITAAALQYLVLCHERFLETIANELQMPEGCFIVKAIHVEQALQGLGLQHIIEPATEAADTQPPTAKRKKHSNNFTAEDRAQQEQLLAASRERALEGANSK